MTGIRGSLTPNTPLQTRSGMHPQPGQLKGHTPLAFNKYHPLIPSHHREHGNVTAETCISKGQGRKPNRDGSFRHATRAVASQASRAKHSGLGVMPRLHMQVANRGRFSSQSLQHCGRSGCAARYAVFGGGRSVWDFRRAFEFEGGLCSIPDPDSGPGESRA